MAKPAGRRKRVNLKEGDVFEFTVSDGRFGYGVIVRAGDLKGGGLPYIIIIASLHESRPSVAELAGDPIALVGWTADALVYHGDWRVIAHDFPRRIDIPYPNWKVGIDGKIHVTDFEGEILGEATAAEIDLLDYETNRAPIMFQRAFEALHGFGEWRDAYKELTPDYARKRMIRR